MSSTLETFTKTALTVGLGIKMLFSPLTLGAEKSAEIQNVTLEQVMQAIRECEAVYPGEKWEDRLEKEIQSYGIEKALKRVTEIINKSGCGNDPFTIEKTAKQNVFRIYAYGSNVIPENLFNSDESGYVFYVGTDCIRSIEFQEHLADALKDIHLNPNKKIFIVDIMENRMKNTRKIWNRGGATQAEAAELALLGLRTPFAVKVSRGNHPDTKSPQRIGSQIIKDEDGNPAFYESVLLAKVVENVQR